MSEATYDAQLGYPFSWTFTPSSGTAFGSTEAQTEEVTPGDSEFETAKFRPISGDNAGTEQFILGAVPVKELRFKTTYSAAAHAAALAAWALKIKGVLTCVYADGTEVYGSGNGLSTTVAGASKLAAITKITPGPVSATGLRTAEITVTTPMPPVFTPA